MREGAAVRTKKPLRLQRQPRGSRWNLQLGFGQRGGMKAVGPFATARHRARLVPGTIFGTQLEGQVRDRGAARIGERRRDRDVPARRRRAAPAVLGLLVVFGIERLRALIVRLPRRRELTAELCDGLDLE